MAFNRQDTALTLLRIMIGVFFINIGLGKLQWFVDTSFLTRQLAGWEKAAAPGSISAHYVQQIAIPYVSIFARLVPLGEMSSGLAMVVGLWTPLFASIAFFMALNFHIASGTIFHFTFLTNPYGLPVLGGTFALALGGARLPWSIKS